MKTALYLGSVLLIVLAGCQAAPAPTASPTVTPTPTPFSGSARVKLDDITVYFAAQGQGEPLILLHGGLGSADDWINQIPVFSQQYRVITPDSRGQGRTTDSEAPLSYHRMAEDTLRLMDYLQIDSAYIVGWSDGAIIGLDLAIHHPERVKALVAYAANISPDGLRENVIGYFRFSSAADLQRELGSEYLRLSPQPEHLPIVIEKIRTMWLTEPNFTAQELAGIRLPALIVDGENEEVIRAGHAQAIASAIPGAELILLPDVGHFAMTRKPDEWNKVVLDFLKDK
jgi:pimeloyl-ACP methyl ester carboxylesterase